MPKQKAKSAYASSSKLNQYNNNRNKFIQSICLASALYTIFSGAGTAPTGIILQLSKVSLPLVLFTIIGGANSLVNLFEIAGIRSRSFVDYLIRWVLGGIYFLVSATGFVHLVFRYVPVESFLSPILFFGGFGAAGMGASLAFMIFLED